MEVEWSTSSPGKLDFDGLIASVQASAAPIGIKRIACEIRRASLLRDEITYKFDQNDPREEIAALYAQNIESAYLVLGAYPGETREAIAMLHLSFDGRRTRLRVETPSLRFLERFREQLAKAAAEPEAPSTG